MRRVFLGVDCGTQSTKVVLRDPATGAVVAVGRAPHELIERDDGTREQDPAWWIDALRSAVRDAVRGEQFDIGGIGVSGQQHGLVCLDRSDRPVRAAKLWNDTTTARECVELTSALGGESRVLELVGNLMLPGYTAPKIAWLAAREPDATVRTGVELASSTCTISRAGAESVKAAVADPTAPLASGTSVAGVT